MYTLIQERQHLKKELFLQVLFLTVAFLLTEKFVDYLVKDKENISREFYFGKHNFYGLLVWSRSDRLFNLSPQVNSAIPCTEKNSTGGSTKPWTILDNRRGILQILQLWS